MNNSSARVHFKLLLLVCICFLSVATYGQSNVKIVLKGNDITIKEVLQEIEKQSKMSVAYNESKLNGTKKVSLDITGQTLEEAMGQVLAGTGYTYQIRNEYIMVVPEKKEQSPIGKNITGKVVDDRGEPLIGATIRIQGANAGTITNIDGDFSLSADIGNVLIVSYLGYVTQHVTVTDSDSYQIRMPLDALELETVVVTALGIKRETKALTYNVQEIKADEITGIKDANFVNSLAGKIAGVQINSSASGIGGSSRVVMRGTKSLFGENNALYVIDGVPIMNTKKEQPESFYETPDGGDSDPVSFLNTDDVENISVLTGAAAAALYGSQGANGVILITTKKGEEGRLRVNYSNSTQFMTPFVMPKFQNSYGSKDNGFNSWGPNSIRQLLIIQRISSRPDLQKSIH